MVPASFSSVIVSYSTSVILTYWHIYQSQHYNHLLNIE